MVDPRKIAILGTGRIGEALVVGLLSSGWREPGEIAATARRAERVEELRERHGIAATLSNHDASASAALIVVAVKPQDIEGLLGEGGIVDAQHELEIILEQMHRRRAHRALEQPVGHAPTSLASELECGGGVSNGIQHGLTPFPVAPSRAHMSWCPDERGTGQIRATSVARRAMPTHTRPRAHSKT